MEPDGASSGKIFAEALRWANGHYETYSLLAEFLTDAELTYDWFLKDCHNATSEHCALSLPSDTSPEDIKRRVDDLLVELYHSPLVVPGSLRPGLLKSGMVRAELHLTLQEPEDWPDLAAALAETMAGNGTTLRNRRARAIPEYSDTRKGAGEWQHDLARLGVSCADAPPYLENETWPTAEGAVDALQGILKGVSSRFGATVNMMEQHGGCQVC